MMNRSSFITPPADARVVQSLLSIPPPSFLWQAAHMPIATQLNFQNLQLDQNQLKKSYCKCCNQWTSEPYESHIISSLHMSNKGNTRNNNQQYEPTSNVDEHKPNMGIIRNINQLHDHIETPLSSMTNTDYINMPNFPNANYGPVNNASNKRNRTRRNKMNINQQQNPVNFNQTNFPTTFNVPDQNYDRNDNIACQRLDEISKSKEAQTKIIDPITMNIGREMLMPVSGIYCTLCDEFFRNNDSAETKHCASFTHLAAYEKLLGQSNEPSEKRSRQESENNPLSMRHSKIPDNIEKKRRPNNKYSDKGSVDSIKNKPRETCAKATDDFDYSSTLSEFQGPDVSLEFPDDEEDYDE